MSAIYKGENNARKWAVKHNATSHFIGSTLNKQRKPLVIPTEKKKKKQQQQQQQQTTNKNKQAS